MSDSQTPDWAVWDLDPTERRKFKGEVVFGGLLPACHPAKVCHHQSLRKRGLLNDVQTLLKRLDRLPACNQWDPLIGVSKIKRVPDKGPFRFGLYRPHGKPWDCGRVKSRELIGGKMIMSCDCCRKNGLQDDCRRTQCRGKPWCMIEPLPKCPPFSKEPGFYKSPDPYDMCPEKPWLQSPEYPAYKAMVKRTENRQDENCIPNTKSLAIC